MSCEKSTASDSSFCPSCGRDFRADRVSSRADKGSDRVDELLSCFVTRPRRGPKTDRRCSVLVHASDIGDNWHLEIGPETVVTSRSGGPADCTITAVAEDLYMLLWNRRSDTGIGVEGNYDLLELWHEGVQIRW